MYQMDNQPERAWVSFGGRREQIVLCYRRYLGNLRDYGVGFKKKRSILERGKEPLPARNKCLGKQRNKGEKKRRAVEGT